MQAVTTEGSLQGTRVLIAHASESARTAMRIVLESVGCAVAEAAALLGRDPVGLALGGGEDFVLAAALPRAADLGGVLDCGRFTADPERRVHETPAGPVPLAGLAYDHFRRRR